MALVGLYFGNPEIEAVNINQNRLEGPVVETIIEEQGKFHAKCSEYGNNEQELNEKLDKWRMELQNAQKDYSRLLAKL